MILSCRYIYIYHLVDHLQNAMNVFFFFFFYQSIFFQILIQYFFSFFLVGRPSFFFRFFFPSFVHVRRFRTFLFLLLDPPLASSKSPPLRPPQQWLPGSVPSNA